MNRNLNINNKATNSTINNTMGRESVLNFKINSFEENIKNESDQQLKKSFLNNMSHELRTPLNGILGFSELLQDNVSAEKIKKYASIIHENGMQLFKIIENMFDLALLEAGEATVNYNEMKVKGVLLDVIEEFEMKVANQEDKKVSVYLDSFADSSKTFFIDDKLFKQVLYQLLDNAFKFTEKGAIYLGYYEVEEEFIFYVKDSGEGIPEEAKNYIYDKFKKVNTSLSGCASGSGVGLTIVKKALELLKGRVWFKSNNSKGTTFFFTIPK